MKHEYRFALLIAAWFAGVFSLLLLFLTCVADPIPLPDPCGGGTCCMTEHCPPLDCICLEGTCVSE